MSVLSHPEVFWSCDWGTSRFRLRLIEVAQRKILFEAQSDEGVSALASVDSSSFESVLTRHLMNGMRQAGVGGSICVISGMATSNLGWHPLPYAKLPICLEPPEFVCAQKTLEAGGVGSLDIVLVSGVCSETDVMRGEECELAGIVRLIPALGRKDHVTILLPGTHCKHVCMERGILTRFTTFMTGELFSHLQRLPTFASCLESDRNFDDASFQNGVRMADESGLAASLFQIRARTVLDRLEGFHAKSFLSGLLIGAELASLQKSSQSILFSNPGIGRLYALAASRLGILLEVMPPEVVNQALIEGHLLVLENQGTG